MKKNQLKVCNHLLLLLMLLALATGLSLEFLHGQPLGIIPHVTVVWTHIAGAFLLVLLILRHVCLNWGGVRGWWQRLCKHRSAYMRWLALVFLALALTGLFAVPQWLLHGHSPLGGWHGKVGYAFALLILWHLWQHWRWYTVRRK